MDPIVQFLVTLILSIFRHHVRTRVFFITTINLGVDGAEGNVGDILPFTSDAKSQSFANKFKQPSTFNDDNFKDFIAGDTRVEENPYLASFHTIFVRYHNLMVDGLRKQRPGKLFRYKLQLCICGTPAGSGVSSRC